MLNLYALIKFAAAQSIMLASAFVLYYQTHVFIGMKGEPLFFVILMILLWAYLSSLILFAFIQPPKKGKRAYMRESH